jgi:hypothetical protein
MSPGRWSGEGQAAWLRRSTLPRAARIRAFLNDAIEHVPGPAAVDLCRRLHRGPFQSAFFELMVGRYLQLMGARLEHEPRGENGARVDWGATFADGSTIYVEATSPSYNKGTARGQTNNGPLLDIIEDETPNGWSVMVHGLPHVGPNDRRSEFRDTVRAMFASVPLIASAVSGEPLELVRSTSKGQIKLALLPVRYDDGPIVAGPAYGFVDDSPLVIARAVKGKRQQGRAFPGRVIVAVDARFLTHDFDFDIALFGRSVMHLDFDHQVSGYSFNPSGELATQSVMEFPGVLAFLDLGVYRGTDPILYVHPQFDGSSLPDAFGELERRSFDGEAITTSPATGPGFFAQMQFARPDE